ncbi:hypothetical protein F0Q45_20780 [Mycobacterium simiae]|uniref:Uncharacterized protein n=1 Tax=Mycobacterium simiae TaxID=1784 RepID=A0A5B1BN34_MYCSI|nr:hypothetical protein [Mycobacterium simiae]KAA1248399.1 hypothetical protein F0Q45_20780 [Mycobacterium simiae]
MSRLELNQGVGRTDDVVSVSVAGREHRGGRRGPQLGIQQMHLTPDLGDGFVDNLSISMLFKSDGDA